MHLPSGTLLQGGRYKIIEKIGQGGFGIVYKALHIGLQRDICIKEFFYGDFCERAENSSNITIVSKTIDKINLVESFRKKFIKEAQRLATFQSPNIVQVMDTFEENNTAYYVMEHIDGGSLENFIESSGALSESKTIEIILPILDALNVLHSKGLLHLDIKPANIMLRKDLTPVLIDFGISKYIEFADGHTTTAPVGISKGYAPLEQYGGNISDFTKATDIYSLCATLYNAVTGIVPPEPLQIFSIGLKSPNEIKSGISDEFNNLIIKGMQVRVSERFQIMGELKIILAKINNQKYNVIKSIASFSNSDLSNHFRFEDAYPFREGLAAVKRNGKWGYIDKYGTVKVQLKYDSATCFYEGLAQVTYNGSLFFIDKNGEIKIKIN